MSNQNYVIWKIGGGSDKKPKKYLYDVGHPHLKKMIFACDRCNEPMWDYEETDGDCVCLECAFKEGIIDAETYAVRKYGGYPGKTVRVEMNDGKIYVAFDNEKFPWEKTDKDYRSSNEYVRWRREVFERDGFKCQVCGQVGGTLNAHHIKPFKDYKDLRFVLSNGVTLCEKCHRDVHKEMRKNGKNR